MTNQRWRALVLIGTTAAAVLNAIWVVSACPIVPMTDLPIWLHQGWLFAQMLRGQLLPEYHLLPGPVPNSTSTVVIGLLTIMFGINVAGKLTIALAICIFVAGAWYVIGSLGAPIGDPLFFLPPILLTTHFFFSGEISHLIGLGFAFAFLGYLLRHLERPETMSTPWLILVASLVFFSSFSALLPMALITFVVALSSLNLTLLRKLLVAAVAPITMLAWYIFARAHAGEVSSHAWDWWSSFNMLLGNTIDLFSPFQGFAPWIQASGTLKLAAMVDALFCAFIVVMWVTALMRWLRGNRKHTGVLVAAFLTLLATILAGRQFATGSTGERFVFPAIMMLCAWLGADWHPTRLSDAITVAACALLLVRGIYLHRVVIPVSQDLSATLAELNSAFGKAAFEARCAKVSSNSWTPSGGPTISHFLPNNPVAIRIVYYDCIKAQAEVPVWPAGIFRFDGPGNYDDQCSWTQCLN